VTLERGLVGKVHLDLSRFVFGKQLRGRSPPRLVLEVDVGKHLKLLIRCANVLLDRASQTTIELDQCDVSEERSILRRW